MSLFKECKTLADKIEYPALIEPEECHWFYEDDVMWGNGYGVYSGEVKEGTQIQDDCIFINIDDGCGMTITKVFLTSMKLTEDEFYDKYEEQM